MTHKHHTKDEQYLICLYEAAKNTDDMETPFDRYEIGKRAGLHERGVNAICKTLLRTNFIKKVDEELVYLTAHGEKLVLRLLHE